MKVRNWIDLSRKLVDRFDLRDTLSYVQIALGNEQLASYGSAIRPTSANPSPFVTTRSGAAMTGTVTGGECWDAAGQRVLVDSTQNFTLASDPSNPRKALLVARYKQTGDTSMPKPSNPITNIFLNLHDDFEVAVILGTPASVPAYPSAGALDVILMGYSIPAAATLATNCTEDATVRQQGLNSSRLVAVNTTMTAFDKWVQGNANSGVITLTFPPGLFSEGAEINTMKFDASGNAVNLAVTAGDTFQGGGTTDALTNQFENVTWRMKNRVWYIK